MARLDADAVDLHGQLHALHVRAVELDSASCSQRQLEAVERLQAETRKRLDHS